MYHFVLSTFYLFFDFPQVGWHEQNFNLPTSSSIFFSSDYLPKGFGIIQNGGSYSEYGRLKNRLTLLLLLTAAAVHIHTNTGKWLLPGSHDIMASLCWLHRLSKCVSLCIFQRLAAGNGRGPLTGLNVAIIYYFLLGGERERKLRKEVSDTSNTYPISLEYIDQYPQ
jgi:hypothetical protein